MKITARSLNFFLSKYFVLIMISTAASAFIIPVKTLPGQNIIPIGIFAIISFFSATGVDFFRFLALLKKPYLSLYTILLVHAVCPLVGFIIGLVFYANDANIRTGLLIAACVPIATSSLLWTTITKGDVSLCILTLSIESFIAPAIIPVCMWVVLGASVDLNYFAMILQLIGMVTLPSLAGMWLRNHLGAEKTDGFSDLFGSIAKLSLLFVVYLNCSACLGGFKISLGTLKLILVVILFASCNYYAGYLGMSVFKNRTWEMRVSSLFCCGMRNNVFAMILAVTYFAPQAAVPLVFSLLVQSPFAGIISYLLLKKKKSNDKTVLTRPAPKNDPLSL